MELNQSESSICMKVQTEVNEIPGKLSGKKSDRKNISKVDENEFNNPPNDAIDYMVKYFIYLFSVKMKYLKIKMKNLKITSMKKILRLIRKI